MRARNVLSPNLRTRSSNVNVRGTDQIPHPIATKKAESFDSVFFVGARDGNRTRTVSHTPLKRARLPVPPLSHAAFINATLILYTILQKCQYLFRIFLKKIFKGQILPLVCLFSTVNYIKKALNQCCFLRFVRKVFSVLAKKLLCLTVKLCAVICPWIFGIN